MKLCLRLASKLSLHQFYQAKASDSTAACRAASRFDMAALRARRGLIEIPMAVSAAIAPAQIDCCTAQAAVL